jgi:hypothetical protein
LVAPLPHGEIIVDTFPASSGLLRSVPGRALVRSEGRRVRVSGETATAVVDNGLSLIIHKVEVKVSVSEGNFAPPHTDRVIAALSTD